MDAQRFGTAAAAWLIKGQNRATIRAPWVDAGVRTVVRSFGFWRLPGGPFQEVPLDPGWTVGVACLRVDLEEHGMVQGEDLCSEFVVGGDVQDGTPGQGHGLRSYSFVVEEGPGIQVRLPGQGCSVDRGVVVEVFGILEQTG
jgi:hypothetical protein